VAETMNSPAGLPINGEDLASWIAETDAQCRQVQLSHHFNSYRSHEEEDFLYTQILEPFVKTRRADLLLYDQYLFAMADPETGRIIVSPQVMEGFPDVVEPDGTPSQPNAPLMCDVEGVDSRIPSYSRTPHLSFGFAWQSDHP
jgi:hypothetical protein